MPSQLVTIVIAVVVSAVLILVVVGLVVVAMVAVLCRRWSKEHIDEYEDTDGGVRSQRTDNTLKSTTYYEPMSPDVDHTHFHHQPYPLHTPHTHTTSDNGDHISMQDCPAYQPIEDTPTSVTGDYTYI